MAVNGEDNHAVIKLAVRIFISLTMLGFGIYVLVTTDWQDNHSSPPRPPDG
jgi:uncharacterized membrane protein YcfT